MPALSFQEMWIDKLLADTKQQTTRKMTDRIKPGDVCHIYNQQRGRIDDKPLRDLTQTGRGVVNTMICGGTYPHVPEGHGFEQYYAHFLGKVRITEVDDFYPYDAPYDTVLANWAHADGFDTVEDADVWFTKRYGEDWDMLSWTVIRWGGWVERYFEPEAL